MIERLLISCLAASLFCLNADAKPRGTHPLVERRHAHAASGHSPHSAGPHEKPPHHDLAYTPKKSKHFKIAKP